MTRFAIVEDDPLYQDQLKEFLTQYFRESGERFAVTVFGDGDEIVQDYRAEYDILLMDVQMTFMDGMTAAKEIRKLDDEVIIIFITNMSQFAIEGYAVDALDYVLKPISYYAFSQCIDRAMGRLKRREKRYLYVSNQRGGQKVDCARLLFVEVHGHNLIYHTVDGDINATGSMKEVEKSLEGLAFFRCNKCDLVNLDHVDGIRDDDAIVNGRSIQLSRAKKKGFLEALNRHINEVRP